MCATTRSGFVDWKDASCESCRYVNCERRQSAPGSDDWMPTLGEDGDMTRDSNTLR
jgi:hypothetical protein